MVSVVEKGDRRYKGDGVEQAFDQAETYLDSQVARLVGRVEQWNTHKDGRTKCGKPCCNRPAGQEIADELNGAVNLKHMGNQANEFYVTDGGKRIAHRKRE